MSLPSADPSNARVRVSIRDRLLARGVQERDVTGEICSKIFPWSARVAENIRRLLGGDPSTAESQFVRELADCSSGKELEECFFGYRTDPKRKNRFVLRIVGLAL